MQRLPLLAAFVAFLALAGCNGGGGGGSNGDTGTLNMSVTDAPIDNADAVFVTFTGIELRRDGASPIIIPFDAPVGLDLLTLQGNNSHFLIQGEELPVGVYDDVRLIVAGPTNANCNGLAPPFDSFVTIDGVDKPLIVPSGGTSGFKVNGGITIAAGQTGDYTVDFDVRKSIAERGATGCYNLKPVMRVVDNAVVGTLTGSIDAALLADASCAGVAEGNTDTGAGAAVYVYEGAGVIPDDYDGLPGATVGNVNDVGPDPLTTALLVRVPAVGPLERFDYTVGFLLADRPYTVAFSCQAGNDVAPETVPPPVDEVVESDNPMLFVQPQSITVTEAGPNVVDFTVAAPPAP